MPETQPMKTLTTTTALSARPCTYGDGPAMAVLTYQFPNHPRRNHYAVCAHHYAEFGRDHVILERAVAPALCARCGSDDSVEPVSNAVATGNAMDAPRTIRLCASCRSYEEAV